MQIETDKKSTNRSLGTATLKKIMFEGSIITSLYTATEIIGFNRSSDGLMEQLMNRAENKVH